MKNYLLFLFFIFVCLKLFLQTHFTEAHPDSDKANSIVDFNYPDTAILNYLIFCFTNTQLATKMVAFWMRSKATGKISSIPISVTIKNKD